MPQLITSHAVLEPSKPVLSASRDVIISGQICGSQLRRVFTLGDGCWLPIFLCRFLAMLVAYGGLCSLKRVLQVFVSSGQATLATEVTPVFLRSKKSVYRRKGQKYYLKRLFIKKTFRGNEFCNYYTKTLCIQLKQTRERPHKYYKNTCFRELFCSNFGQDGSRKGPFRLQRCLC